jgi:hypothetical protein
MLSLWWALSIKLIEFLLSPQSQSKPQGFADSLPVTQRFIIKNRKKLREQVGVCYRVRWHGLARRLDE